MPRTRLSIFRWIMVVMLASGSASLEESLGSEIELSLRTRDASGSRASDPSGSTGEGRRGGRRHVELSLVQDRDGMRVGTVLPRMNKGSPLLAIWA